MSVQLTADAVDGALDNISGETVINSLLSGVMKHVVKLKAEAVLPIVVHTRGFLFRSSLVDGNCL